MEKLNGKKTYITGILMAAYNLCIAIFPQIKDAVDPATVNAILIALIGIFLRDGVKKLESDS